MYPLAQLSTYSREQIKRDYSQSTSLLCLNLDFILWGNHETSLPTEDMRKSNNGSIWEIRCLIITYWHWRDFEALRRIVWLMGYPWHCNRSRFCRVEGTVDNIERPMINKKISSIECICIADAYRLLKQPKLGIIQTLCSGQMNVENRFECRRRGNFGTCQRFLTHEVAIFRSHFVTQTLWEYLLCLPLTNHQVLHHEGSRSKTETQPAQRTWSKTRIAWSTAKNKVYW